MLLDRAAALLEDPEARAEILLDLGVAPPRDGRPHAVRDVFAEAFELAGSLGDERLLPRVQIEQSSLRGDDRHGRLGHRAGSGRWSRRSRSSYRRRRRRPRESVDPPRRGALAPRALRGDGARPRARALHAEQAGAERELRWVSARADARGAARPAAGRGCDPPLPRAAGSDARTTPCSRAGRFDARGARSDARRRGRGAASLRPQQGDARGGRA